MAEISISHATEAQFAIISQLAHEIWWPAYGHFIPHGQISLMLEQIYAEDALQRQAASGGHFLLAWQDEVPFGFSEYRTKLEAPAIMRIEKLYVSPRSQGQGMGRRLIEYISVRARDAGKTLLELNVNRSNETAIGFYRRNGFETVAEIDTPYHGYLLDDYVMQKKLLP